MTILLILTRELRYPQIGVNRKKVEVWKLFSLGGRQMTYFGEGSVCLGDQGREKLYRLTIKWTSFKTVVEDFPYTLRVPSSSCRTWLVYHSLTTSSLLHDTKNTYVIVTNLHGKKISQFTKTAKSLHYRGIKFRGSCIRASFRGI